MCVCVCVCIVYVGIVNLYYMHVISSLLGKQLPANTRRHRECAFKHWLGKIPLEEDCPAGNSLQYSCLENPMDRGAWWVTVHMITKSRTQLSTHAHI